MTPLELTLRLIAGALLILTNGFFVAIEFAQTRARQFSEQDPQVVRHFPRPFEGRVAINELLI